MHESFNINYIVSEECVKCENCISGASPCNCTEVISVWSNVGNRCLMKISQ